MSHGPQRSNRAASAIAVGAALLLLAAFAPPREEPLKKPRLYPIVASAMVHPTTRQLIPGTDASMTHLPETLDWWVRAGSNATDTTLTHMDAFVSSGKSEGWWPKGNERINLQCGTNLLACNTPLVIGGGASNDANHGFVESDYSSSLGLTGDGSSYLDTGYPNNTDPGSNMLVGVYMSAVQESADFQVFIGERPSGTLFGERDIGKYSSLEPGLTNYIRYVAGDGARIYSPGILITNKVMFIVAGRSDRTTGYTNGYSMGGAFGGYSDPDSGTIFVHALNETGTGPIYYSLGTSAGYWIGRRLVPAHYKLVYSAFRIFNDSEGR